MKWESVKKAVASTAYDSIRNCRDFNTMAMILTDVFGCDFATMKGEDTFTVYADKVYDTIMVWDIRAAERLRRLFPQWFPKCLSKGTLTADMDDDGDWTVCLSHQTAQG